MTLETKQRPEGGIKRHTRSSYFRWGLTVFLTAVPIMIVFFILYRYKGVGDAVSSVTGVLRPFVMGGVMAYLICPLYNLCVRVFSRINWPGKRGKERSLAYAKGVGTFVSVITILAVIAALLWAVLPQLIQSISVIAAELPDNINRLTDFLQNKLERLPGLSNQVEAVLNQIGGNFSKWVQDTVLPHYDSILSGIGSSVMSAVSLVLNFFVGLIVCSFTLNRKEIFADQIKKLSLAVLSKENADSFLKGAAFTNRICLSFISGKIIDSIIIGIICFIFMSIVGWPYTVLISVIIGVTNIIPFFGPFIGAIPSALLMLMVSPKLALFFVLFIVVLQQVDGNIIGPKILGETTGLASFWVLFAIIVGGGLFGVLGMVLGVPVFAVIYAYACYAVNRRLEKKGLSTDLRDYRHIYHWRDHSQGPSGSGIPERESQAEQEKKREIEEG